MKLHFDHALVARLLAHAQAASEHSPTYDQLDDPAFFKAGVSSRHPTGADVDRTKIPAGLMLVGDNGIYLMSNGYPILGDPDGHGSLVAYASEADPRTRPDDWYDVKRASFGGDDGAEFLSADTIRKALEATVGSRLWIDVTPARISCPYLASPQKNRSGQPDGGSGKACSE
ncbi:hypothetical protein CD178_03303 (plasmid) [Komagataeibacter saccharivorans]|uniref:DUF3085 domain-containing protein n=2 Tax=Acetobacteraceae TaxID=433 RepID=A0A347WGQ4_9PROT|nr:MULTISPECIES: DUF3085 domain-containing protein [Acetobacteraceae]AXY24047.1 hypothetical protein CD178_03303 [Komagataeibacter saccharivorans]PYD46541.1 DUF3085 domain-containing protein [Novacetimonas pomaceti]